MRNLIKHKQQQIHQGIEQSDYKERVKIPLLGVGAVLASIAVFIIALYILTIVIRLLFAL